MAIEIIFKKIQDGRRQTVEILGVEALEKDKLPSLYFQGSPFVYKSKFHLEDPIDKKPFVMDCLVCCIEDNSYTTLKVGDFFEKKFFLDQILPILTEAGDRLQKVNTVIKKRAERLANELLCNNECNEEGKDAKEPWQGQFKVDI